jgi:hypothetical protein
MAELDELPDAPSSTAPNTDGANIGGKKRGASGERKLPPDPTWIYCTNMSAVENDGAMGIWEDQNDFKKRGLEALVLNGTSVMILKDGKLLTRPEFAKKEFFDPKLSSADNQDAIRRRYAKWAESVGLPPTLLDETIRFKNPDYNPKLQFQSNNPASWKTVAVLEDNKYRETKDGPRKVDRIYKKARAAGAHNQDLFVREDNGKFFSGNPKRHWGCETLEQLNDRFPKYWMSTSDHCALTPEQINDKFRSPDAAAKQMQIFNGDLRNERLRASNLPKVILFTDGEDQWVIPQSLFDDTHKLWSDQYRKNPNAYGRDNPLPVPLNKEEWNIRVLSPKDGYLRPSDLQRMEPSKVPKGYTRKALKDAGLGDYTKLLEKSAKGYSKKSPSTFGPDPNNPQLMLCDRALQYALKEASSDPSKKVPATHIFNQRRAFADNGPVAKFRYTGNYDSLQARQEWHHSSNNSNQRKSDLAEIQKEYCGLDPDREIPPPDRDPGKEWADKIIDLNAERAAKRAQLKDRPQAAYGR